MPEIVHKVVMRGNSKRVYDALTTIPGLSGWWTSETSGEPSEGSQLRFAFGPNVNTDMKIVKLKDGDSVQWECVGGLPEWLGTKLAFSLEEDQGETTLYFSHTEWEEATRFMAHCSTKWAAFLFSLKEYIECGTGRPYPYDLNINSGTPN